MMVGSLSVKFPSFLASLVYWISVLSYGMYLWNNLIARFIENKFHSYPWPVVAGLYYGLTFFMAFLTYFTIEKPFLRLRGKMLVKHG